MEDDINLIDNTFVIELLNSWGVSIDIQNVFKVHDIDGFCLDNMTESDIDNLIPVSNMKDRIRFRAGLKLYRNENKSLGTASFETESITSDKSIGSVSTENSGGSLTSESCSCQAVNTQKRNTNVDLMTILKSNSAGELCLASLKKNNKLDSSARNYLVKSVVEFYLKEYGCMNRENYEDIASQIVAIAPSELKETYYIPSQKYSKNKYIPARGKLVDKYNNQKRVLRKSGVLENKKTVDKTVIEDQHVANQQTDVDENVTDGEYEETKIWLKFNKEPLTEILEKWKRTSKHRLQELQSQRFTSIRDIINEWPSYKLSFGYKLIEVDFDIRYPNQSIALFKKWPEFLKNAISHFKTIKSAEEIIKCLEDNPCEDVRDFCFCSLIGSKIPPTIRVQIKGNDGKKLSYKPSTKEAINSFIIHAKNQSEVLTQLDHRRDAQLAKGLRCQPIIVVVGGTIDSLTEFYVAYDNILYKIDSFLKTLDICFKTFHCLDAEYPVEAIHIWTFIQKYFYNMHLKSDRKLSGVSSFISDLN